MIRIERPPHPPDVLWKKGEPETRKNCESHDRYPDDYRSGTERFAFKGSIYGDASVKRELLRAQHGKCCYCESRFSTASYGEIEHFRPKGSVKHERGRGVTGPDWGMKYPGYYWLAYDWNNLLVSCGVCNRTKGSQFPLVDDGARARSHHDDVGEERPLFIDPSREDPRRHIRFRGDAVEPLTCKGHATIVGLGLRRWNLREARMKELGRLRQLRYNMQIEDKLEDNLAPDEFEKAKKVLDEPMLKWKREIDEAMLPKAEYSAMARDLFEVDEDLGDGP